MDIESVTRINGVEYLGDIGAIMATAIAEAIKNNAPRPSGKKWLS